MNGTIENLLMSLSKQHDATTEILLVYSLENYMTEHLRVDKKTGFTFYNGRPEYKVLYDSLMHLEEHAGFKTMRGDIKAGK